MYPLPKLLVSTTDFASLCQSQTAVPPVIRNDSRFDGADANGQHVSYDAVAFVQCPSTPPIALLNQISVDGGLTWLDADTAAIAPTVVAPSDAQYRLIIRNTGKVTLTNVNVSDPTLGLTSVPIASQR